MLVRQTYPQTKHDSQDENPLWLGLSLCQGLYLSRGMSLSLSLSLNLSLSLSLNLKMRFEP